MSCGSRSADIIDRRIEQFFTECESIDRKEHGEGSYVAMNSELTAPEICQLTYRESS